MRERFSIFFLKVEKLSCLLLISCYLLTSVEKIMICCINLFFLSLCLAVFLFFPLFFSPFGVWAVYKQMSGKKAETTMKISLC